MSDTSALLSIGRIAAVYGVKGWVKVVSYTEPREQIFAYQPWLIGKPRSRQPLVPLEILDGKPQGKGLIAQPQGCEDRNAAELLIGNEIWTPREQLAELENGEYYWHQLEQLKVMNENGEYYGRVDHLIETGANDVLVVKPNNDSIDDRERLVPYVEGLYVDKVDLAAGCIHVTWDKSY